MKILSRHSDTARAFAYLLKQWDALNVYCSNGRMEIDNNIAENALQGVAVGRKNWLFAGSDSGGEHVTVLYSLIGTCRLNNVEPEKWLRYGPLSLIHYFLHGSRPGYDFIDACNPEVMRNLHNRHDIHLCVSCHWCRMRRQSRHTCHMLPEPACTTPVEPETGPG